MVLLLTHAHPHTSGAHILTATSGFLATKADAPPTPDSITGVLEAKGRPAVEAEAFVWIMFLGPGNQFQQLLKGVGCD